MSVNPTNKNQIYLSYLIQVCILLPVLFAVAIPTIHAAEPIIVSQEKEAYPLGLYMDILEDKTGVLTIKDILKPETAGLFQQSNEKAPGFGFSDSAYWARIKIKSKLPNKATYYLDVKYPMLDHVEFYVPDADNKLQKFVAGDHHPFHERVLEYTNFVFPVPLQPGREITCFLLCRTTSSVNLPAVLLSSSALAKTTSLEHLMQGIYFGIVLVMILYNLFLFITIKDTSYLYYVLFIFGFMIFQLTLNGFSFQYLWPNSIWWANNNLPFFIFFAYMFGAMFTRSILYTRKFLPKADRVLYYFQYLGGAGMVLSLFADYSLSIKLATALCFTLPFHIYCGLKIMLTGYRPAFYYAVAWSVSLVSIVIYSAKTFDLLPNIFFTQWSAQIGSAWEVLLLAIGLADRFHLLEEEKKNVLDEYTSRLQKANVKLDEANIELLDANTELNKLNLQLEERVVSRTTKLSLANYELSREAQERKMAEDRAKAASLAKSTFLANMSHEIRTPMNAIIGMTRLALKNNSDNRIKTYLQVITTAGHTLLGIINDILDFSKIEAGKLEIENIDFSLQTVMANINSMFTAKAREKNIILSLTVDDNVPDKLKGDPLRLEQIIINLVNNSLKFTDQGEVKIEVSLANKKGKHITLFVSVTDTGIGLSNEETSRLFTAFSQSDNSTTREYGGTGLGLAICKQLVNMMDGEIKVTSTPGKGSTFYFTVVVELSRENLEKMNKTPVQAQPEISTLKEALVLLVEDNKINQQVAVEILEDGGINVEIANNGQEALIAVKEKKYDAILMDIQMPTMDGFKATQMIRSDNALRDVPIIAMTAHAMKGDREKCLESGMNDYIAKPIDPDILFSILAKWLQITPSEKTAGKDISSLPTELPGLKLAEAQQRLNNNKKLLFQLLQGFAKDYKTVPEEIKRSIDKSDLEAARHLVHNLKGVAGNLSIYNVSNIASEIEKDLKENKKISPEQITALAEEMTIARQSISRIDYQEIESSKINHAAVTRFDRKKIARQLNLLLDLLASNDLDAEACLAKIMQQAGHSDEIKKELIAADQSLQQLDFQTAGSHIKTIIAALDHPANLKAEK